MDIDKTLDYITLIDGEFRSFIRNFMERMIGNKLKKKYKNPYKEIIKKLAIRTVASLIAIRCYRYVMFNYPEIEQYVSWTMVAVFIYFVLDRE